MRLIPLILASPFILFCVNWQCAMGSPYYCSTIRTILNFENVRWIVLTIARPLISFDVFVMDYLIVAQTLSLISNMCDGVPLKLPHRWSYVEFWIVATESLYYCSTITTVLRLKMCNSSPQLLLEHKYVFLVLAMDFPYCWNCERDVFTTAWPLIWCSILKAGWINRNIATP